MTTAPRVWLNHWGLFAGRSGAVSFMSGPGFMAGKAGSVPFATVLGLDVAIFDTRAEHLPFHPDKPDCRGFRLGPYFVAVNRGKAS